MPRLEQILEPSAMEPEQAERLLRYQGFEDPHAVLVALARMARSEPERKALSDGLVDLLAAAARTADPAGGLLQLERIAEATGDPADLYRRLSSEPDTLVALFSVTGSSRSLSDLLASNPDYLDILADSRRLSRAAAGDELRLEASRLTSLAATREDKLNALRRMRRREYLRIGARELTGLGTFEEVVGEISDLAAALVAETLSVCHEFLPFEGAEKPESFAVLAFGKLGARELNYSSDIDLAIVWENPPDDRSTEKFDQKLAQQLVEALSNLGAEGRMYRVDLRLRPFGSSGPIGSSISTLINYYESWSEPWERQALIKCRAIAGPRHLRQRVESFIADFAFSRPLDSSSISHILALKERSEQVQSASGDMSLQVKHGWGGIRDIEFTVQLLQLVAGYRYPEVRAPATMDALAELRNVKVLSEQEYSALVGAYEFLRQVEHRLQLVDEQAMQIVPSEPDKLRRLAYSLGYRDEDGDQAGEAFLAEYQSITSGARAIHERLFKDYLATARAAGVSLDDLISSDEGDPSVLARWEFAEPAEALRRLRMIARGSSGGRITTEPQRRFVQMAPELLESLARSPDPDRALAELQRIAEATGSPLSFFRSVAGSRAAMGVFARLAASSPFLVDTLVRHPEYLDVITDIEELKWARTGPEFVSQLLRRMSDEQSEEGRLNALRRYRGLEMLRIGVRDVAGLARVTTTMRQISLLAQACVRAALHEAAERVAPGSGLPGEIAVFAAGKAGGQEMHYYSDLDLFCVYREQPRAVDAYRAFDRAIRAFIDTLSRQTSEGRAFQVDLRLRPEGNAGVVAMPLAGYRKYLRESAAAWERLAFIRCRQMSGSLGLGSAIARDIAACVWGKPLTGEDLETLRKLKLRIEQEKSAASDTFIDLKRGPGGILDIEFTAQLLQLAWGGGAAGVRSRSTLGALRACERAGIISKTAADALCNAYLLLRKVDNRLQMSGQNAASEGLLLGDGQAGRLARQLGLGGGLDEAATRLIEQLRSCCADARRLHEIIFFETDLTREAGGVPAGAGALARSQ